MSQDIDIRSEVDLTGRRFLAAIEYYGGEASMTDIRQRTGLSRDEADWRFRKHEDIGLIEVSYADHGRGDRDPPRVANITGKARAEIERGLLYDIDESRTDDEINDLANEVRALREDIHRVENKVNVLADTLSAAESDIDDHDADIDWLCDDMDDIEAIVIGIRDALESNDIDANAAIRAQLE